MGGGERGRETPDLRERSGFFFFGLFFFLFSSLLSLSSSRSPSAHRISFLSFSSCNLFTPSASASSASSNMASALQLKCVIEAVPVAVEREDAR